MVTLKAASSLQSVGQDAQRDVQRRNTRSHAYFSATSVVPSACAFLRVPMATSRLALATTIGRPREEDLNAHNYKISPSSPYLPPLVQTLIVLIIIRSSICWLFKKCIRATISKCKLLDWSIFFIYSQQNVHHLRNPLFIIRVEWSTAGILQSHISCKWLCDWLTSSG
uniref:Uncharacterized protein n=1 Tax=Opuntia streptacantha TaxID=393608 RepID=A0A7C9CVM7_OPUST